jgi:hypothetical protein
VREQGRDVYRYGHDILEDWVLSRVLDERLDDLPAALHELGQPVGALRALQLVGMAALERSSAADQWIRLLEEFAPARGLSPRWQQALLLAPLHVPHAPIVLDAAAPVLLANDGALLRDLLRALCARETLPNLALLPGAVQVATSRSDLLSMLLQEPLPSLGTWEPLMQWLVPRLAILPPAVQAEAARVMLIWQRGTPAGWAHRRAIGVQALEWLSPLEWWPRGRQEEVGSEGSTAPGGTWTPT